MGPLQLHSAEKMSHLVKRRDTATLFEPNCISHYLPVISNRLHCVSKNWMLCFVCTENKLLSTKSQKLAGNILSKVDLDLQFQKYTLLQIFYAPL